MTTALLKGRKILIVDDEPDVLDTLTELLSMCEISTADSFDKASDLLVSKDFDLAILDIMGVNGYELLKIATSRGVIPVMLTARALALEDTVRSYREGAAAYIPKDEMAQIEIYLNDVLELYGMGKNTWTRWYDRFVNYYNRKFGLDWQEYSREFLEIYHLENRSKSDE